MTLHQKGSSGTIQLLAASCGHHIARAGSPLKACCCPGAQVTTIDSHEHYVLAGSLDGYMSKWDLRAARQGSSTTPQDVSPPSCRRVP